MPQKQTFFQIDDPITKESAQYSINYATTQIGHFNPQSPLTQTKSKHQTI